MVDLDVERVTQHDPRLGRHKVHDPRSREFPRGRPVNTATWRSRSIRLYDPLPNPNQPRGNCTGCASAMCFNAVGNRRKGQVLRMDVADEIYSLATQLDPWEGSWPPVDTGSSGLAAATASQRLGYGGTYRWLFGGADEVVQTVVDGEAVSVGTWWYDGLFIPDRHHVVEPTGRKAGGHQYVAREYDAARDLVGIRCWWGPGYGQRGDVWIKRAHLDDLLLDGGDAHVQERA